MRLKFVSLEKQTFDRFTNELRFLNVHITFACLWGTVPRDGCIPKLIASAGSTVNAVPKFTASCYGSAAREQWRHRFCHFLLWLLRLQTWSSYSILMATIMATTMMTNEELVLIDAENNRELKIIVSHEDARNGKYI